MAFSRCFRAPQTRRRAAVPGSRTASRQRFLGAPELLEDRRLLSLASADYDQPDPAWFATVELPYGPRTLEQAAVAAATASGTYAERVANPLYQPWIVRLTRDALAGVESITDVAQQLNVGAARFAVVRGLGMPGQVLVSAIQTTPQEVEAALRANPYVSTFEQDGVITGQATPNDPKFASQIGLHNIGQDGGTNDADVDAPEAWNLTTGSRSVVVAVIDTGVDYTHPDLAANIWTNPGEIVGNGVDDDYNGFVDDVRGYDFFNHDANPQDDNRHGTHVAGTIGAIGNNAVGVAGTAWVSSILPVKFLDANNQGPTSAAIEAINYVTTLRRQFGVNVRVINASWGGSGYSGQLRAEIAAAGQADILFVAAAGNGDVLGRGIDIDQTPFYPASYDLDNIISVAASDQNDKLVRFSNYGSTSVDLAAPGVGIVSTEPGSSYASRNGTSMAAPHVTGTAALVWSRIPYATAAEVRQALLQSVDVKADFQGDLSTGGRLNAYSALTTDTVPPRATLSSAPNITAPGDEYQTITVTYTDDTSVNVSTLDGGDLLVTRPDHPGETYMASFVSVSPSGNGPTRTATYRMAAPGGTWGTLDNGEYRIELVARQVADVRTNYARAAVLGTFRCEVTSDGVFEVNTTADLWDDDPGDGDVDDGAGNASLRGAVLEGGLLPGGATIIVPAGVYALSISGTDEDEGFFGDLDAHGELTILGAGVVETVIDGLWLDRVFDIHPDASLTLSNLTITGGNVGAADGGGLRNRGTLTLDNVTVTDNSAGGEFRADGPESRVNTVTTDTQQYADVATDAAGNYVVVWETRGTSQSTYWFQRYAADGTAQGGATLVGTAVTLPASPTWRPISVSTEATGKFAIAWTSAGTAGNGLDVVAQRYFADGTVDGSQLVVLYSPASRTGDQVAPAVAIDSAGDLVVAWQDLSGKDTSGYGIYTQRFRGTTRTGGASLVNTFVTGSQRHPAVDMDAAGNFVVVWESANQDGDGYGVYGRRGNVSTTTFGTEFRVHAVTAGDQSYPAIAMDGGGSFAVAWQGPDDDTTGIFARQFDSRGTALGSELLGNTTTTGAQTAPAVAIDADGAFVIAWTSAGQDGSGNGVFGQRFSALGTPRGEEFSAHLVTSGDQLHPRTAINSDDSFVVTWDGNGPGDATGIHARRFDVSYQPQTGGGIENSATLTLTDTTVAENRSGGDGGGLHNAGMATVSASTLFGNVADGQTPLSPAPIRGEFLISSTVAASQYTPRVAFAPSGASMVVWDTRGVEWGGKVYGQMLDAQGALVNGELAISTDAGLDPQWEAAVAFDSQGNYVVTWTAWMPDGNHWGVLARMYAADGTPRSAPFVVNSYTTDLQAYSRVAIDRSGNFVIVWCSLQNGSVGVYGQRYNALGQRQGGEFQANITTTGDHVVPEIVMDEDGTFVVTWFTWDLGGDISLRRYRSDGTPLTDEICVSNSPTAYSYYPRIAADALGNFVVAWDVRTSDTTDAEIYARSYARDCTPLGDAFRVNSTTLGRQESASVSMTRTGEFIVTWDSLTQDGDEWGVYGQLFDASGNSVGAEFRVNTTASGSQSEHRSAISADGRFLVAWQGNGPGDSQGIFGQLYQLTQSPTGNGGGIANTGTLSLTNVTLSGNEAAVQGGGLFNAVGAETTSTNATITGNSACGENGISTLEFAGGETKVNSSQVSSPEDWVPPGLGMDAEGDFVVVWQSNVGVPGRVYSQWFHADGSYWGGQFQVCDSSVQGRGVPSVALDPAGNVLVAWNGFAADAQDWGVNGQWFDADGNWWGGRFLVNAYQSGDQQFPIVAASANGSFLVTWVDSAGYDGSGRGVFGQLYNSSRSAIGGPILLPTHVAGDQWWARAAMWPSGGFVATWYDLGIAGGPKTMARRFAPDGSALGDDFVVNSSASTTNSSSSVAIAPDGSFLVTWSAVDTINGTSDVFGRWFDMGGIPLGGEFRINQTTAGSQASPMVSIDSAGRQFITWLSDQQDPGSSDVYGRYYDPSGAPVGDEFRLNATIAGSQYNVQSALSADGNAVAIWRGNGPGDPSGIFAQRLTRVVHDGGGVYNSYGGTVTTHNTLIAGNTAVHESPDVAGAVVSLGGNLVGDMDGTVGLDVETRILQPEFRINATATGTQGFAAIGMNPAGSSVVIWRGNPSGQDRVYGQRFDNTGQAQGDEIDIGATTSTWGPTSALAVAPSGDFVVVWEEAGVDGIGYGIVARRFSALGSPLGSPFVVNSHATGNQEWPGIAIDQSGNFVIVWSDDSGLDGSGYGVYAQRYAANGSPLGENFRVNTYTADWQYRPVVASDSAGNFVVTWMSNGQDGSGTGVYAQRFAADGTNLGTEFRANTATNDYQGSPSVAMDSDGDFVIAWTDMTPQDGSEWGVFGQRFSASGEPQDAEFQINTYFTSVQQRPLVDTDAAGNFIVAWMTLQQDGDLWGIAAQRFDSLGKPVGSEFLVNSTSAVAQHEPRVALSDLGGCFIVWQGNGLGDDDGVFGARYQFGSDRMASNVAAYLGPLADNGGPTMTHALLPGSPAIDSGSSNTGAPNKDQRGLVRPQDGNGDGLAVADIGAYEVYHASLQGTWYRDTNGNGVRDAGELGVTGETVFLDKNSNGVLDFGELSTTTRTDDPATSGVDEAGLYSFLQLAPGTYAVVCVLPDGWEAVAPVSGQQTVSLYAGQAAAGVNFATRPRPAQLRGQVFNDANHNHSKDPEETGLAGWTVYLDADSDGTRDAGELSQTSDSDGRYVFADVPPLAHYTIAEVWQENWEQTYPTAADSYVWGVDPAAGEVITDCDFGNYDLTTGGQGTDGVLKGRVFRDNDEDRIQDPGELGLIGYTVYLDLNDNGTRDDGEPAVQTRADDLTTPTVDETGLYQFSGLAAGTYIVRLLASSGARQTAPVGNELAPSAFPTGEGPQSIALGDFDRNGKPDLVIANGVTNNLSLLLNTGTGSFGAAIQVAVGYGPASVLARDLDGDSDVDLVAANLYGGTVSILKNRGTGSFEPPVNVAIWGAPRAISAGDFDHDGDLDLAVADEWNDAVALLRNNGTGAFTFIGSAPVGLAPSALATVQLNDDNGNSQIDAGDWPDLAVTNFDANNVSVLMGRADGSLAPAVNYTTGLGPFSVAAGDLDRDGYQDLVVANVLANTVAVLRNLGTGTFAAAVTYAAGAGPSAVSVGDLDGDADLDVLVTNGTSKDLSVLRNRGNGTFEPAEDFGVGDFPLSLPFSVAAGDLNADSVLDVAVANGQANNVSVLLNTLVAGAHRSRITGSQTASGLDFGVSLNNALPTLDAIPDPPAVQENTGPQIVHLTGITAGGTESQTLEVTAMSLNVALVPDPVIQYTSPNTTGTLNWQPLPDQSGQAIIEVTVRDAGPDALLGTQDDGAFSRTFAVTVNPGNRPPTLDPIPDPAAIDEDAGLQTVNLSGITAGTGETQALRVTATSDHVSLIPDPTVAYASPNTTGTLTYTPLADQSGSAVITVTVRDTGPDDQFDTADDGLTSQTFTVVVQPVADIVGRHIFYNNSKWDNNSAALGPADDLAIATDKQALRNGQQATLANYTSYSRGIYGIMLDIEDLADAAGLSVADFTFRTGNNSSPAGWSLLALDPSLITVAVRSGAGVDGSDRVTILFPEGAVKKTWLQVTVKATDATGLVAPDVHYWGNAIGDSGDAAGNTAVNVVDALGVRANPHTLLKPAPIDDAYDYNRDKQVNVQDELLVRANPTTLLTDLNLIDLRGAGSGEGEAGDWRPEAGGEEVGGWWLVVGGERESRRPGLFPVSSLLSPHSTLAQRVPLLNPCVFQWDTFHAQSTSDRSPQSLLSSVTQGESVTCAACRREPSLEAFDQALTELLAEWDRL